MCCMFLGLTQLAYRAFGRAVFYILVCAVISARSAEITAHKRSAGTMLPQAKDTFPINPHEYRGARS